MTRTLAALLLGLALTLTACGGDDSGGSARAADHNDADVHFATAMIEHHAQALEMVELTDGRKVGPQVRRLADDIRKAQTAEIETMTGWLEEWGEEVPETDGGHGGHDMEGMDPDVPGMMSADDLEALAKAPDAVFEEAWLELMVAHHEGALEMAETEQVHGTHEGAVALAADVVETQTAEIDKMKALLGA